MKRKKVRVCFSVDRETLRCMDRLARKFKISRSGVVELAIEAVVQKDRAESAPGEPPLARNI